MARRTRNPTVLATVLWAGGAAFVGLLAGYGLSNYTLRRGENGAKEWLWWIDEVNGLLEPGGDFFAPLEIYYRATIQSPTGARVQLSTKKTREAAEKTAIDAIAERGGIAVEGKPISG